MGWISVGAPPLSGSRHAKKIKEEHPVKDLRRKGAKKGKEPICSRGLGRANLLRGGAVFLSLWHGVVPTRNSYQVLEGERQYAK